MMMMTTALIAMTTKMTATAAIAAEREDGERQHRQTVSKQPTISLLEGEGGDDYDIRCWGLRRGGGCHEDDQGNDDEGDGCHRR